jgi:sugar lactone lactonase YvrE
MFQSAFRAAAVALVCIFTGVAIFAQEKSPVSTQFNAWVLRKFPDIPRGLGIDSKGNIFVSLLTTGELVMLKNDGSSDHVAWVPSKEESGKGLLIGLDFDKEDNIYVAYKANSKYDEEDLTNPFHPGCRDATVTRSGVYKIEAKTQRVTALAIRADGWPFCFPLDVKVDSQGNLYMADVAYSGIWKISPDGRKVDLWSAHRLLNWSPALNSGFALGVSGLVFDKPQKNLYAVTIGDPAVLRIPIKEDGSAGEPQQVQSGYSSLDGIVLDKKGTIYVSEILRNEIWALSADGSHRQLIASKMTAPLDNNTALILKGDVLCTANEGFSHDKVEHADRTVVCMTGFSVP